MPGPPPKAGWNCMEITHTREPQYAMHLAQPEPDGIAHSTPALGAASGGSSNRQRQGKSIPCPEVGIQMIPRTPNLFSWCPCFHVSMCFMVFFFFFDKKKTKNLQPTMAPFDVLKKAFHTTFSSREEESAC
jgi:hypothetical protein